MILPEDVAKKLGMIKAYGVKKISVEFAVLTMEYKVEIDDEVKMFKTDEAFYEYVDNKLKGLQNEI